MLEFLRKIFYHGIHDPTGLSYLIQLRVGLSKLNFHKFKRNFRDNISPKVPTNDGIEDTEHFLLLCPSFAVPRKDLLTGVLLQFDHLVIQISRIMFYCRFHCMLMKNFTMNKTKISNC